MALEKVKLNSPGMAEMLKSAAVAAAVHAAAEATAANLRSDGAMTRLNITDAVAVNDYTTDRAATSVTITHPAGMGVEGKHGTLTTAARHAGLEVNKK